MAYVYNGSMTLQRQATSETFLALVIGTVVEDSGVLVWQVVRYPPGFEASRKSVPVALFGGQVSAVKRLVSPKGSSVWREYKDCCVNGEVFSFTVSDFQGQTVIDDCTLVPRDS